MIDLKGEEYEVVELDGIPALFIEERIEKEGIPEGLFCYDIRHNDEDQGIGCEIANHVRVNFWATVITKEESPMKDGSCFLQDAIDFQGYSLSVEDFMKEQSQEQIM